MVGSDDVAEFTRRKWPVTPPHVEQGEFIVITGRSRRIERAVEHHIEPDVAVVVVNNVNFRLAAVVLDIPPGAIVVPVPLPEFGPAEAVPFKYIRVAATVHIGVMDLKRFMRRDDNTNIRCFVWQVNMACNPDHRVEVGDRCRGEYDSFRGKALGEDVEERHDHGLSGRWRIDEIVAVDGILSARCKGDAAV